MRIFLRHLRVQGASEEIGLGRQVPHKELGVVGGIVKRRGVILDHIVLRDGDIEHLVFERLVFFERDDVHVQRRIVGQELFMVLEARADLRHLERRRGTGSQQDQAERGRRQETEWNLHIGNPFLSGV